MKKITMKKIIYLVLCIAFLSCNKQEPIQFTEEALSDTFVDLKGSSKSLKSILDNHKGTPILIEIWASWCGDCIKGMPKLKALQNEFKDVAYVFLSLDREEEAWKKGIEKYNLQGEHYFMDNGKKGGFADFVNIDWIPRYMVVDANGNIKVFKAVEADDSRIAEHLN